MGLARLAQGDFSAGMVRATARELIPANGAWDLLNILLDQSGDAYRRGGVLGYSTSDFGAYGLTFAWDGRLLGGQRTVIGSPAGYGDAAGIGIVDELGAVTTVSPRGIPKPVRGSVVGGILFLDGGLIYAGSRKGNYSTGTVAVVNGSATVVGTGTVFNVNSDDGAIFRRTGDDRFYAVKQVHDGLTLTLSEPYQGVSGSGVAYTLEPVAVAPIQAPVYFVVGKRLFICDGSSVRFTEWDEPQTVLADNEHKIPGGAEVLGGAGIGDTAVVFTTDGVWTIANTEFDAIDERGNVQHILNRAVPGLILWAKEGIASFGDALVVPATDGVYLVSAGGQTERLDRSISPLYLDYVQRGYRTGLAAVYRNHYFLPIISAANRVVDVLVCRLDGKTRRTDYPWTHLKGDGANVRAYTVRVGSNSRKPQLLGASGKASSRLVDCSRYFDPGSDIADDLGTDFDWQIVTRDYPTGQGNQNVTRRVDLHYEGRQDLGDTPEIIGEYGIGARIGGLTEWGEFDWGGADWSPPDDEQFTAFSTETAPAEMEGLIPKEWWIAEPPRSRYIRLRFRSSDKWANLRVSGIALWTRQSTKAD